MKTPLRWYNVGDSSDEVSLGEGSTFTPAGKILLDPSLALPGASDDQLEADGTTFVRAVGCLMFALDPVAFVENTSHLVRCSMAIVRSAVQTQFNATSDLEDPVALAELDPLTTAYQNFLVTADFVPNGPMEPEFLWKWDVRVARKLRTNVDALWLLANFKCTTLTGAEEIQIGLRWINRSLLRVK